MDRIWSLLYPSVSCIYHRAIYHVSDDFSFYVGEHKGPEPGRGLCIAQASLLEAVPPMCVRGSHTSNIMAKRSV